MAQDPEQRSDPPGHPSGQEASPPLREFLLARWQLLRLEATEASRSLTIRLAAIIAAAAASLFAYALLLVAIGWALTLVLSPRLPEGQEHWSGPIVAGLLFLLHLITALVLLARARNKSAPPLFECSRAEWKKDQEWLQKEKSHGKSAN